MCQCTLGLFKETFFVYCGLHLVHFVLLQRPSRRPFLFLWTSFSLSCHIYPPSIASIGRLHLLRPSLYFHGHSVFLESSILNFTLITHKYLNPFFSPFFRNYKNSGGFSTFCLQKCVLTRFGLITKVFIHNHDPCFWLTRQVFECCAHLSRYRFPNPRLLFCLWPLRQRTSPARWAMGITGVGRISWGR